MNLRNLFKRKARNEDKVIEADPNKMPEPKDLAGFMQRGWAYHSRGNYEKAEVDFRRGVSLDPESIDAYFVLGLVYKAQERRDEAVKSFKKSLKLLETGKLDDRARTEMLRRLSLGHINELEKGDWDLETEVWRRGT